MKIFPHWVQISSTIEIDGVSQPIRVFGRSAISPEDAFRFAQARVAQIQSRIQGQAPKITSDYVADIREEIVKTIDSENIVTRNRYGSEVLNSTSLCFIDIDSPRFEWKYLFRRASSPEAAKARILKQIEERAAHPSHRGLGFRVYETFSGYRVLVSGGNFKPRSPETASLLKAFHCDSLYAHLCHKQDCFRARLTPKSYRMHYKGHRVKFPRTDQNDERDFQAWLAGYEQVRRNFATCRFVRNLGPVTMAPGVALHDHSTQAFSSLPLA